MLIELLIVAGSLLLLLVKYIKKKHRYWKDKGVPYIEPKFPFGNLQNRFKQKMPNYEAIRRQHVHFKSQGHKYGGLYVFTSHIYLPVDPDLIKQIMTKDFSHFQDHGLYYDEKNDPLSAHLFALEGQRWRSMRSKITPTFTSGKIKNMFHILLRGNDQLKEHIDGLKGVDEPLDIKDVLSSYTMDVIGSCAFGFECNSFKDPRSDFRENGRKLFRTNFDRKLRFFSISILPSLSKMIGLTIFEREITDFYFNVIKDMVRYREESRVRRDDYLQILLELKNASKDPITFDQLAAQVFGFVMAGFETTSMASTFCLFELALNPDVQEKLRKEIRDVLDHDGDELLYDSIMNLKYLGQVVEESLRKYPPLPIVMRKCVEDYKIPDTDITLDKGKRVFISVLALHFDPEYYPNPEKFDPDRFSDENKAKRPPFTFLPFGEGPRMCVGLRFALMQIRVAVALILSNYRLKVNPKTELPLQMDPQVFLMMPLNKIWLDVEAIN